MYHGSIILALAAMALLSLFFSTLTFALRDFSRTRLHHWLKRHRRESWHQRTVEHAEELAFVTALVRLLCNIGMLIGVLAMFRDTQWSYWLQYAVSFVITGVLATLVSVAIPLAIARHGGEMVIGFCVRFLWLMHTLMAPAVVVMRVIDRMVGRAAGPQTQEQEQQDVEDDILTAVEDGAKEGIVDQQEREMIESVIEFRDAMASEVMTSRPDIVALDSENGLTMVRAVFEKTGISRIPVYQDTLDHIIGVLYARDLLKYVGESAEAFEITKVVRQPFFVPETKPLRDLLRDFRSLKIHMAIVLDEYGGTAGLITIEDVLEQLVGEISDEHEPHEPAMFRKIDEQTYELDGRMSLADLGAMGVNLPEDEEIHTVGGYVATAIGRIPETGAVLNQPGTRFTVIEAEPQRIIRLRLEILRD